MWPRVLYTDKNHDSTDDNDDVTDDNKGLLIA